MRLYTQPLFDLQTGHDNINSKQTDFCYGGKI